jgi:2-polyprenyl-3-methyl-5-hydroxy-6-metoxy-1,4-benzoquinol methylase
VPLQIVRSKFHIYLKKEETMSDWYQRWNNALREQHKLLFDYDKKRIKEKFAQSVNCPVCGKNDSILWLEKDWFRWYRCRNCSMVYMNPRLNNEATHQFYNSDANAIYNETKFDQETSTSLFDDRENTANLEMIDELRNHIRGNLLEIGSGNGRFLKKANDLGYRVYGLELNQRNCQYSRQLLEGKGTVVDVDLLEARLPTETFDVIYMRDLLQHIPNPLEFLQECSRVAKQNCIIFLGTHNIDGAISKAVRSRYTPVFGFMEPNHYSPKSITKILERVGFKVRKIQFESIDFTVLEIIRYYQGPTFTTVFPGKPNRWTERILKFLRIPLTIQPLSYIDNKLLPAIANSNRMGSWMNVLAEKA